MPNQMTSPLPPPLATAAPPSARYGVRIVDVSAQRMAEWQALEDRLECPYLTCSAEWTRLWLKYYGDIVPHRVAILTADERQAGMCLVTNGIDQHEGPFAIRTLHIGTAGEADGDSVCVEFNRLLSAPELRPVFAQHLLAEIQSEPWEYFSLDGMPREDARAFVDLEAPTSVREVPSYYCDLNLVRGAPSEPWRLFGESTRTNLRRSLRDLGDVTLDWAESSDQALQFYDEMIGYHQQRWNAQGKPGVFSSERFRGFHRELIAACVPHGRATLVRARQQDRVLGILYLLIEDNRLLYYQAGLPEHQSKLSLGNVTQYLTMLEGAQRGYVAFDFMGGDAQYKRVLSTHHDMLYWARWRRPSVKFLVLDGLRSIKNCLKGG